MGRFICAALLALCASWAAASDSQLKAYAVGTDGQLELAWDNGNVGDTLAWGSGNGTWLAVDFDISMIQSYRKIDLIRVYSQPTWPNGAWDGFLVGVFSMVGSTPGSMLWGPNWARGTAAGAAWVDAPVAYSLPAGANAFAAGMSQYYDYPNCDPWTTDNNMVSTNHSWYGLYDLGGPWGRYSSTSKHNNLMIRVVVNNTLTAVRPASLGRVKAAYY